MKTMNKIKLLGEFMPTDPIRIKNFKPVHFYRNLSILAIGDYVDVEFESTLGENGWIRVPVGPVIRIGETGEFETERCIYKEITK